MAAVTHPFVLLGMASAAAALAIAVVAWYQRESPGAPEYTLVMGVLATWSVFYVIQLLQPTVSAKAPWLVARHAITPLIGVLFWIFAARYTDRARFLSAHYLAPIVAVGAVLTVVIIWNPRSLYWVKLSPAVTNSLAVVDIDFGTVFWLNAGYTLGVVAGGHLFIVGMFRESLAVYRPQLTAMTVIGILEFGLTAMFLSDHVAAVPSLNPWPHIQLITYGTTLSVIPIGWSYVNGALFKLQPLAERTVIENMDDAVFVFDRTDILRYSNSTAIRLLDRTPETSIDGEHVEPVFGDQPELLAQYRRTGDQSVAESEPCVFEVDGEQRYYDLRSSVINNSFGVPSGTVVVARDVTETTHQRTQLRERTEELEAKKATLEQQNEQLDQFSSFVSHDLRNPLHVASGYLGLVRNTGDLDHLDKLEKSLKRMNAMVDDLRKLTRIDHNELSTAPVDVEAAAKQAWAQVDTADAALEVADLGAISADRELLLHVLENVFRNSIDHGRDDINVRVGPSAEGLYIEDDGPGIPESEREAVLEHGYSTAGDGTGLGMSIVKTIVEAHGWEIAVTESDTGGARFELTGVDRPADTPAESAQAAAE